MRPAKAALLFSLLLSVPASAGAIPTVYCEPETTLVDSAEVFQIGIRVCDLDTLANFQIVFTYDYTVIEFLDAYEGTLYANSGLQTWFNVEEESLGTWEVWDCIFPALTYLLPPGELCRLEFRALRTGSTSIEFLSVALTDRYREAVVPLTWRDGYVFVGDLSGVGQSSGAFDGRIGLPWPNPTHGTVHIRAEAGAFQAREWPAAAVYDTGGRILAWLTWSSGTDGRSLTWNGLNASGEVVPAGVYYIRTGDSPLAASRKVVLLR